MKNIYKTRVYILNRLLISIYNRLVESLTNYHQYIYYFKFYFFNLLLHIIIWNYNIYYNYIYMF